MLKKNVVLLRVSTDQQTTDSQLNEIKDYCNKNNIPIDLILSDEGISGSRIELSERKNLNKILEMAKSQTLNKLIVYNSDRIARKTETVFFLKTLNQYNVQVLSATEGILNSDNEDISELLMYIKYWNSSIEAKKIGLRSKAGKRDKFENQGKFISPTPPFGYIRNKDVKEGISIDDTKVELINHIFELYLNTSTSEVLDYLRSNGYNWQRKRLIQTLKNTTYIGYLNTNTYDKPPFSENLCIVNDNLFQQVQKAIASRTIKKDKTVKTNKSQYLLESLVYHECSDGTKHKMHINYVYNKPKVRYPILLCDYCKRNKLQGQKSYGLKKITNLVEAELINQLNQLDINELEHQYNSRKYNVIAILKDKKLQLNKDIELKNKMLTNANKTLQDMFINNTDTNTIKVITDSINQILADIKSLEDELVSIDNQLIEANSEQKNKQFKLAKLKHISDIYENATDEQKKILIKQAIDSIIIGDNLQINLNI